MHKLPGGKLLAPLLEAGPKLFLAGSALTLIVASVGKLFTSLTSLQSVTQDLFKSFGGDERISAFVADLGSLSIQTKLSTQEIVGLASAMQQNGIYMQKNNGQFNDLIRTNAKAMKMFNLSTDSAAAFSRAMLDQGKTSKDIEGSFDHLFQVMQKGGGTVSDLTSAVNDGIAAWKSYASVSGLTAEQFSNNMLDMRLSAKALNVDFGLMQKQYSKSMDPMERRRQASFMTMVMGGSQSKKLHVARQQSRPKNFDAVEFGIYETQ